MTGKLASASQHRLPDDMTFRGWQAWIRGSEVAWASRAT